MIFSKSKVAPSFAEQMQGIKAAFKTAHESASNLHSQMEEEIKSKESQIASLKSDIETINGNQEGSGNLHGKYF